MVAGDVAPKMGVKCALVERARVGGDCLWTGCVPSKALIASAKAAHAMRTAGDFGLAAEFAPIDTGPVFERVRRIQREIAETDDNPQKYIDAGVDVIHGDATLVDGHTVDVSGRAITTKFILIATGSRPAAPPIAGIADVGYLTSETLFEQQRAPASMLIVGGGPIAIEMAQAHHRLGVRVTVLQRADRILERDEPALTATLLEMLRSEGIEIVLNVDLQSAETTPSGKMLRGTVRGNAEVWTADEILVAAGRKPNVEGLRLEEAGIAINARGVVVDSKLRTSVESVYACGDVAGRFLFTHSAAAEAVAAMRNMFYPGTKDAPDLIPWATFTEPELAHAGMTSTEAREKLGARNVRAFAWAFSHNDRARTEQASDGQMIAVTDAKFKIVGAHILAPAAGEMIGQFALAIAKGQRLTPDFGNLVQVYPTFSTSFSQLAAEATYGQLRRPFLRAVRRVYGRFS
jgi:pyruvate/2-oxoglutarate dehydrogenase complex dihydrolipoamide dehydrogenase (E3) component